jgi:hypothetical protein
VKWPIQPSSQRSPTSLNPTFGFRPTQKTRLTIRTLLRDMMQLCFFSLIKVVCFKILMQMKTSLCSILKSQDRTLATLVGRALAAQGFLFDVTYSKKLKDSRKEIYRCDRSVPGEASTGDSLPTGVFTILTDCFVSTCTKERMCYSVSCPRRLAQVCVRFRSPLCLYLMT